jgi:hypothetical protein
MDSTDIEINQIVTSPGAENAAINTSSSSSDDEKSKSSLTWCRFISVFLPVLFVICCLVFNQVVLVSAESNSTAGNVCLGIAIFVDALWVTGGLLMKIGENTLVGNVGTLMGAVGLVFAVVNSILFIVVVSL